MSTPYDPLPTRTRRRLGWLWCGIAAVISIIITAVVMATAYSECQTKVSTTSGMMPGDCDSNAMSTAAPILVLAVILVLATIGLGIHAHLNRDNPLPSRPPRQMPRIPKLPSIPRRQSAPQQPEGLYLDYDSYLNTPAPPATGIGLGDRMAAARGAWAQGRDQASAAMTPSFANAPVDAPSPYARPQEPAPAPPPAPVEQPPTTAAYSSDLFSGDPFGTEGDED